MSDSSSARDPVEELAEEFAARYRRGERPSVREYTDKYPELAEQIRELFPALVAMEQLGSVAGPPTGPFNPKAGERDVLPEQLGDYRILREVGRGGMGVVYEAVQESLGRHVALKILPFHRLMDPLHLERFRREARAAAQLHHTNIVPVFGVGETEGIHYYAMQFIQGQGLDVVLEEVRRLRGRKSGTALERKEPAGDLSVSIAQGLLTGRFQDRPGAAEARVAHPESAKDVRRLSTTDTPSELASQTEWQYCRSVAQVGVQVAEALAYAHKQRILHRDIKPSNLLLDTQGTVWITDFGLAKAEGSEELTSPGDIVGTVRFMAPERFQGKADPRSDVYSLGITLYEMLSLRPAFADSNRARLVQRVTHEDPPRLREPDPHIPRDVETIIMKTIAKEPAHRYPRAESLADDLRRFLAGQPIRARRVGRMERLWRWSKRNPALASLTAAVFLLLAAVAGVASVGYVQTRLALNGEAKQRAAAEAAEENTRRQWYAANLSLMQKAWDTNDVAHLRSLLAETQRYPDRSFEWYYWQRLCHLDLHTFIGHRAGVFAVCWSPDGKRLATASPDGTTRVWEAGSGRELFTLRGHTNAVHFVSWSPNGKQLATGSGDNTVKVWDAAGGQELLTLEGHTDQVWSVSWSPDGNRLATGSNDGTVKVWEAAGGRELATLKGHTNWVWSVSWSPDGKRLATASTDGTAKVWDVAGGPELFTLKSHARWFRRVSWSVDGRRLATGGEDGTTTVWDAIDGRQLLALQGHRGGVQSAIWSPDGKRLATGSADGTAKVWDAADGRELLPFKGHTGWVESVSWSPDGKRLATASRDGTAKVWDTVDRQEFGTLRSHKELVLCISWSSDGRRLATGSGDGTAKVWDAAGHRELISFKGHADWVSSVSWSPDETRLATASEDGTTRVWAAADGRELLVLKGRRVCWSPDGMRLATVSEHATATVWDAVGGRLLLRLQGHGSTVTCLSWSPDSQWLATGSADGTAIVWDGAGGRKRLTFRRHTSGIRSISWSPDGERLATGSDDGMAKVWNAADGQDLLTLQGATGEVYSVSWSPDSKRLVTGSEEGPAKVWDAASGQELLTLPGSPVSWSPDGKRLATGSGDGTVKVWEAASNDAVEEWTRQDCALDELYARNALLGPRGQGFIQTWLLLLPLPFASKNETGAQALERQQLDHEGQLRPRLGESVQVEGRELVWQEHRSPQAILDFNAVLGRRTEYSLAYAVCYLESDRACDDLRLQVGSDDQAKLYLNSQQIYQYRQARPLNELDPAVPVTLKQGTNVLLFKVVNESMGWEGCVRLVDEAGRPAQGIRVKLSPEP